MRVSVAIVVMSLLAGCAAPGMQSTDPVEVDSAGSVRRDADTRVAPEPTMSAAAQSLLEQGRTQRLAGEYMQASATLERALRIEPSQPRIWLELGKLRFDEGDYGQSEQMARKVLSLTPVGDAARVDAQSLIDRSRAATGR
ncbi:MAG: tetratricopeptide repeat protein [Gammaproteobacteria bacterium]|nr:tetratricopeptide repeat protein [Gammaproteobacteria bacterium]MBT8443477.1 tetratricopeptide repeat protein [Gammaproteobacteria bacterium]